MGLALPNYDHELRRQCAAGTARYKAALAQAGYCKPDRPDTSRPERTIDMPWPGAIAAPVKPSLKSMVKATANEHGVDYTAIKGRGRKPHILEARWDAFSRLYATGRFSLPQIARFFNRDHTTILHGIRKHTGGAS